MTPEDRCATSKDFWKNAQGQPIKGWTPLKQVCSAYRPAQVSVHDRLRAPTTSRDLPRLSWTFLDLP